MSGRRALRYASVADMPASMRARCEAQLTPAPAPAPMVVAPPERKPRADLEHEAQRDLIDAIDQVGMRLGGDYALAARRTHAVPNAGRRTKRERCRLLEEGMRAGVSDLFVALPRGGFPGLYIEMKSPTGTLTDSQRKWLLESHELGYAVAECRSKAEAFAVWDAYVNECLTVTPIDP